MSRIPIIFSLLIPFLLSCESQQKDEVRELSPEAQKLHLAKSAEAGALSIFKEAKVESGNNKFTACFENIPNLITGEQFNTLLNKGANLSGEIEPDRTSRHSSVIAADTSNISQKSGYAICTYAPAKIDKKSSKNLKSLLSNNQAKYNSDLNDFLKERVPLVRKARQKNTQIKSLNEELIKVDDASQGIDS